MTVAACRAERVLGVQRVMFHYAVPNGTCVVHDLVSKEVTAHIDGLPSDLSERAAMVILPLADAQKY